MSTPRKPHSTRVFRAGNSQAVRIPKALELVEGEVYIERRGAGLFIAPKGGRWEAFFAREPFDLGFSSAELRDRSGSRAVADLTRR